MEQEITLAELPVATFAAWIGRLLGVYTAAMDPPERQLAGREQIMEQHTANPAFRALAALDADGEPAGFSYGFRGESGQWWHDMVAGALASRNGAGDGMAWLADSFEVAELHVLPKWQGRGIGRSLLLGLTQNRPERTAVLSTHDSETVARRLYRSAGFTDLLTGFRFSGGDPAYAVMGAVLPLRDPRDPRSSAS
ncbi:MAG: GNAT family N-acetyltransferase [Streptosporangiaceae bacterium]